MGEWVGLSYFGVKVMCPQCRRNLVKQTNDSSYAGFAWKTKTKCECLWCANKWEIPEMVKDIDSSCYESSSSSTGCLEFEIFTMRM